VFSPPGGLGLALQNRVLASAAVAPDVGVTTVIPRIIMPDVGDLGVGIVKGTTVHGVTAGTYRLVTAWWIGRERVAQLRSRVRWNSETRRSWLCSRGAWRLWKDCVLESREEGDITPGGLMR
jgi:hypothetical protein